ncbi:MAG TPA: protein kinase [Chloroflexota bacterium]|nr:protein kinase [Chloroflexota bacterium]
MAEQLLNGRYRLLRPLGTGGMASVYLAEDLRLGRRVAVKVLHPQFASDPTYVARLAYEARIAAGLAHPNVVQVYDVGHDGDRHYIVMEYVEGETLKDLIRRQGALPVARALAIMSGVLAALALAHAHRLIHRDITAQNILLTSGGDVKVTDFGIARELSGTAMPTLTLAGMVLGTVHYFAPEQAQGRPAIPQSDVYAAGIVLYEMLTGTLPFDAENPLAVAMQQINQAPTRPTRLNPAIPPSVEAIVLTALAKNPVERFAGAAEMQAAVDAARSSAVQPTRAVATAPTTAMRPLPPRGAPRVGTRSAAQATVNKTPAGRTTRRALRLTAAALVTLAAALLGYYVAGGSPLGFGGFASATPTPSATATTPAPTRTPTATPRPPTATPRPTATRTPRATPTATSAPPTATETPDPTATPTAAPSDTPTPATTTPTTMAAVTPTTTLLPNGGAPAIQFTPVTATAGGNVTVTGSSWPDGALVTLSVDFGHGDEQLASATTSNGSFATTITLPPDITASVYTVTAQDGQGDVVTQTLTVGSRQQAVGRFWTIAARILPMRNTPRTECSEPALTTPELPTAYCLLPTAYWKVVLAVMDPGAVALQAVELASVRVGRHEGHLRLAERVALAQEGAFEGAARDLGLAARAEVHPAVGRRAAGPRAELLSLLGDAARWARVVFGAGGEAILIGAAARWWERHELGAARGRGLVRGHQHSSPARGEASPSPARGVTICV